MAIRALTAADAAAFVTLRLEGLRLCPEAFGASYAQEREDLAPRAAALLEGGHVFGAFDAAGALQGVIGLHRGGGEKTRHIATLWGLYVTPAARGRGLAAGLLAAAIAAAPAGCHSLRLSVNSRNGAAQALYLRAGFRVWAVEEAALQVAGVFHDEAHMRLDLGGPTRPVAAAAASQG